MDLKKGIAEELIVIGDKVDLVTQTGDVYRTMIEDRLDNGPFLAGVPNRKGVHMYVNQDDDVYLVFYRESGRYIAQMKVLALENRGGVRYMWLIQKTQAQKNQRREAFRLPVTFDVQIFEYDEEAEQGITFVSDEEESKPALEEVSSRDLSVTGIALITKKKYELEEKYLLSLHLSRTSASIRGTAAIEKAPALHLTATVKRCIPWRTGNTFNTGMHFFGMKENMSDGIARYVLTEQQRQIKRRGRLV